MADVNIVRPQAGQRILLDSMENARLVLAFSPADATLEREGDNLVFKFEDGGHVVLTGFYTAYDAESLPSFQIDGAEVTGKDFFAALGEDLMPAAGPAAAAAAPAGGRYNEFGNDSLMDGVDRLDGLDVGFDGATAATDGTLGSVSSLGGTDVAAATAAGDTGGTGGGTGGEPVLPPVPPLPTPPPVDPTPDPTPPPPPPVDMDALKDLNFGTVFEGALADGTMKNPDGDDLISDNVFGDLGGLPAGWEVVGGGNADGKLVQDADGNWRYELTTPSAHPDHGNDASTGKVEVVLKDPFGRDVTVEVDVKVVDDAPITNADSFEVKEGGVVEGNVLTNDQSGADKWPTDEDGKPTPVTGVTPPAGWTPDLVATEGDYVFKSDAGTMVINKDGSYTFTSNADSTAENTSFEFTYTVTDRDGDTAEGTLNVDVKDVTLGDTVIGGGTGGAVVDEADILPPPDSDRGAVSEPVDFTLPEGASFDASVVFVDDVAKVNTDNGTFTITANRDSNGEYNGTYEYTYTLTKPFDHTEQGADTKVDADSVELPIIGANGNTGNVTLTVDVKDDVPTAGGTGADIVEGGVKEGNLLVDDTPGADKDGTGKSGADGWADGGAVTGVKAPEGDYWKSETTTDGSFKFISDAGDMVINKDGSYKFTSNADSTTENTSFDFTYTVTDKDGDTAEGTLNVNVKDVTLGDTVVGGGGDGVVNPDNAVVDEAQMGSDKGAMSNPVEFRLPPDASFDASVVFVDDVAKVSTENGTFTITNKGDGNYEYTYELTTPVKHEGVNSELKVDADSVKLPISDANGNKGNVTLTVDVKDDVPTITVGEIETSKGENNNLGEFRDLNFHDYNKGGDLDGNEGKNSINFGAVTVSAGRVTYDKNGEVQPDSIITGENSGYTLNKGYDGFGRKDDSHGLTVRSDNNLHPNEIGVDGNKADAVIFDLGGKLAYGLDLTLGCFFQAGSSTDTAHELARISFYKGGELIHTVDISSNKKDGVFNADGAFKEFLSGGFDKVIISPVDNGKGDTSDFLIRDIGFETIPNPPFPTTTGTVTGDSGADGYQAGYANATFNYKNDDMLTLRDKDGADFEVTLKVEPGGHGGGSVTATDGSGAVIFTAVLGTDGKWVFNQYKEFTSVEGGADGDKNTFDLSFITKDSDGDTAITEVPITTTQSTADTADTHSFSLMADDDAALLFEGDAPLFGESESYDNASAAVVPSGQAEYLDDGDDDLDALLGDAQGLGGLQGLGQDDEAPLTGADDLSLTNMATLCDKLGISQNSDGTLNLGDGGQAGTAVEVPVDITESTHAFTSQDDISIAVQENLIKTDTGAA